MDPNYGAKIENELFTVFGMGFFERESGRPTRDRPRWSVDGRERGGVREWKKIRGKRTD